MPRPPIQQAFMQAEFEELARQRQDLEARELEGQRMTQTCNLNAVRDAGVVTAASVPCSRHSRKKKQAPGRASSKIASKRSQTPSGAPPSGIKVSTGMAQTVAPPPVSSQDGANQEVKAMVQDIVKCSLTQLGVIPQDAPTKSLKFAEQTPSGSQTQLKTATTQAQLLTSTHLATRIKEHRSEKSAIGQRLQTCHTCDHNFNEKSIQNIKYRQFRF